MTAATARRSTQKKTADAPVASALPLPKLAKGEIYVGRIGGPDGQGEHIVLLPGDKELTWSDALAWAKSIGGDLPNRVEQALLFAHHRKLFEKRAYWSNTQDADDERWAWYQHFYYGGQDTRSKGSELRVRAVRRVPIR